MDLREVKKVQYNEMTFASQITRFGNGSKSRVLHKNMKTPQKIGHFLELSAHLAGPVASEGRGRVAHGSFCRIANAMTVE